MKQRISIFISLLAVCLLLSTLMACAPATPPIDDTPVPTPDTPEPDIDTPIDSSVPEQNVTPTPDQPDEPDAPDEPITPIEPIEDYELPSIHYGIYFSFYSMEDIFAFFEIMPHLSKDSEAHATLQTAGFYDCTTYYLPNPEKVPDGYEFIYANISPEAASFSYSSTPENYQEYPWYWPDETTWSCDISFEWYEINRVININGEPVRFADDYVIPYKIGTNDHVTE